MKFQINKEQIQQYFHLPLEEAAIKLGCCSSVLKRTCRQLGIKRWPYRRMKSLSKRQNQLQQQLSTLHDQYVKNKKQLEDVEGEMDVIIKEELSGIAEGATVIIDDADVDDEIDEAATATCNQTTRTNQLGSTITAGPIILTTTTTTGNHIPQHYLNNNNYSSSSPNGVGASGAEGLNGASHAFASSSCSSPMYQQHYVTTPTTTNVYSSSSSVGNVSPPHYQQPQQPQSQHAISPPSNSNIGMTNVHATNHNQHISGGHAFASSWMNSSNGDCNTNGMPQQQYVSQQQQYHAEGGIGGQFSHSYIYGNNGNQFNTMQSTKTNNVPYCESSTTFTSQPVMGNGFNQTSGSSTSEISNKTQPSSSFWKNDASSIRQPTPHANNMSNVWSSSESNCNNQHAQSNNNNESVDASVHESINTADYTTRGKGGYSFPNNRPDSSSPNRQHHAINHVEPCFRPLISTLDGVNVNAALTNDRGLLMWFSKGLQETLPSYFNTKAVNKDYKTDQSFRGSTIDVYETFYRKRSTHGTIRMLQVFFDRYVVVDCHGVMIDHYSASPSAGCHYMWYLHVRKETDFSQMTSFLNSSDRNNKALQFGVAYTFQLEE